jgi:hypothetical protein
MPVGTKAIVAIKVLLDLMFCRVEDFTNIGAGIAEGFKSGLLNRPAKHCGADNRWNRELNWTFCKLNECVE